VTTNHRRSAFTLVELLVVIAIIGVLASLLLPAVQASRESARGVQCKNNLKEQATGMRQHLTNFGHFPPGGWGYHWAGDADLGHDRKQPGGWIYSILPFVGQNSLYQLASDGDPAVITDKQRRGTAQLVATPIRIFNCPSRRPPQPFENPCGNWPKNADKSTQRKRARSDYAVNRGDYVLPGSAYSGPPGGPDTFADAVDPDFVWPDVSNYTGIVYCRTAISEAQIRDGMSATIMLGEKFHRPQYYTTGEMYGDNFSMYVGASPNVGRYTCEWSLLRRDDEAQGQPVGFGQHSFGSAHIGGCNFAFCDGHVQTISYAIHPHVYRLLGNRHDGQPISASDF
jgi:prepilin-type N-terminal cleavage/methylation domain-containing protein/prepilin-type processing-associated H-X9-DG protein